MISRQGRKSGEPHFLKGFDKSPSFSDLYPQIFSTFQILRGVVSYSQRLLTHSQEIHLLSLSFLICQMELVTCPPTDFLRLKGNMYMKGSCQQFGY